MRLRIGLRNESGANRPATMNENENDARVPDLPRLDPGTTVAAAKTFSRPRRTPNAGRTGTREDDTSLEVAIVPPVSKEEWEGARKTARAIWRAVRSRWFEFARALHVLWRNQSFMAAYGYTDWAKFLEDDIGIGLRDAQCLRQTYEVFSVEWKGLLPEADVARIPELHWTKLHAITQAHPPVEEIPKWIERAATATHNELRAELAEAYDLHNVKKRNPSRERRRPDCIDANAISVERAECPIPQRGALWVEFPKPTGEDEWEELRRRIDAVVAETLKAQRLGRLNASGAGISPSEPGVPSMDSTDLPDAL